MNETNAPKPVTTSANPEGAPQAAATDQTTDAKTTSAESLDGEVASSADDEPLDEIASIKGVEKHVLEKEALERELEQAHRQGAAMLKVAAPIIIRAMAELPLPRGYGKALWKAIQKQPKLLPPVRAACYFVCVHLWKQDDAADLAK